jgi:phytoene dehydrogenase-like protein
MTGVRATVVGSGPNGLAAAIVLARAGCAVTVREAAPTVGGGLRSAPLTKPGFVHDVCASVMPLGALSPFLRSLPLADHGLAWTTPPVALAHPFDDGSAAVLEQSLITTSERLGADCAAYRALMQPLLGPIDKLLPEILAPLHVPRHPLLLARFGMHGIRSAEHVGRARFRGEYARALLGGTAAHAVVRLDQSPSAAFALVLLVAAHAVGWPFVRGGSQGLADALVSYLRTLGGTVIVDAPVRSLDELETPDIVMLDLTPPQVLALAGHRLPAAYASALRRYRFGPGVFKVDWALSAPVPWTATDARRSGVLHLGGRIDEIAAAEADVWEGRHPERPFVILAQPTVFDSGRAPPGSHTLWAYCHVPNGSAFDMTSRIENQIERFAPGFRDLVIGRHAMAPAAMQAHDANLIGGEIGGGENSLAQLFFRPVARRIPYATPLRGVYICSASTPPGGAIHGMGGYHAAKAALRALRLTPSPIGPEHRGEWG